MNRKLSIAKEKQIKELKKSTSFARWAQQQIGDDE